MATRTVEAERFVLLDDKRRPRMVLEMLHGRSPALSLFNEQGNVTARLWEANGKPLLQLTFDGSLRASLAVAPDASTALIIGNNAENVTVALMAGEPAVILRRADGARKIIAAAKKARHAKPRSPRRNRQARNSGRSA